MTKSKKFIASQKKNIFILQFYFKHLSIIIDY